LNWRFNLLNSGVDNPQDIDTEILENTENEAILDEEIQEPSPDDNPTEDLIYFARRLRAFKQGAFGDKGERAIKSGGLAPTFSEIAQLIDRGSGVYREVELAYKNIEEEGEEIEREILPLLWEKLIDKNVEIVEQEINRNSEFAKILENQLKNRYFQQFKSFQKKLDANQQKQEIANSEMGQRFRRKPKLKQRLTNKNWRSDIPKLQQQRKGIIEQILDQLSDEAREDLVKSTVAQIEQLPAGEKEKIRLIHNSLYRLTNEESQLLINDVLSDIARKNHWDEELTKQKRALYGNYQTYKKIQRTLDKLPNSVKESFAILARRSQTQVQQIGHDIMQFRQEVSVWFDRSMARSSGVYKRNIKGITFLIGFLLAVIVNADTLFMFHRLTKDENLRQVVTQQAIQIAPKSSDQKPPDLDDVRKKADEVLKKVTLPIGWNPDNFSQQLDCQGKPLKTSDWQQDFSQRCLKDLNTNNPQNLLLTAISFVSKYWLAMIKIFFGWLLAAMAISMGAPFWFDLLGKVVNVRNAGSKPASSEDRPVVSSSDSTSANTTTQQGKVP
jgi:tetrahydromethanopterin S-methyltransferase subunit G